MANTTVFTKPLVAGQVLNFEFPSSATGISITNNTASAGNISILGSAQLIIGGVLTNSTPINIPAGISISLSSTNPLSLTVTVDAGTSGYLIVII